MRCWFVTDLHGSKERCEKLFELLERERPDALFLGGDILPQAWSRRFAGGPGVDFLADFLVPRFLDLRSRLLSRAPRVFVILGNDDGRLPEAAVVEAQTGGAWEYVQCRQVDLAGHPVFGYSYVPPTPFLLKDFERYDVSRHVDPGCVSPEEGMRTVHVPADEQRYSTIVQDLSALAGDLDLSASIWLFHAPPYETVLDRAALDGRMVDHVPLDVHVGSIAIRRFIEERQPAVTLHGHIHESVRITGEWRQRFEHTWMFTAAHDGPELCLVRFDPAAPDSATRELI